MRFVIRRAQTGISHFTSARSLPTRSLYLLCCTVLRIFSSPPNLAPYSNLWSRRFAARRAPSMTFFAQMDRDLRSMDRQTLPQFSADEPKPVSWTSTCAPPVLCRSSSLPTLQPVSLLQQHHNRASPQVVGLTLRVHPSPPASDDARAMNIGLSSVGGVSTLPSRVVRPMD